MKLFLASYRFGAHVDEFLALTGTPGRVAVVANAADSWPPAARASAVTSELTGLRDLGFVPEELDLRKFVGRAAALAAALDSVETIWLRGGNTFVLRARLQQSGADDAITTRVRDGRLIYAGYSAGACVASTSLRGVEAADDPAEVASTTGLAVPWDGLGLIDIALIPHLGSVLDFENSSEVMISRYQREGTPFRTLNDDQVLVVDGDRTELL
ncbi:Type 1 glutamine amidotransferase-like domain-containing protein [Rhodococcoides yunnanense]|uniref:Type 1 glutamine amidotransferase-like domain-containing protein n=1 Tax=Rhodococcoides yunnanense TaxID=278209 RepID=UPI0009332954|nr:Type 1 glutamine amidotransferase-like domain-containing protein [Rhodococcus yunnanensis]